jgi:outer membrane protein assembly factor BamB
MSLFERVVLLAACATIHVTARAADEPQNWPGFRGPGATGVLEGHALPTSWNADPGEAGTRGVLWRVEIPGLGHSSPVVWGDRIFLCTAIAENGKAPLVLGAGGKPTAADDSGQHRWVILCYDKSTGKELWRKTARRGIPRATRHVKVTQANTSLAVDGTHLVAFFGSEGLYCYDLDGQLQWSRDLGVINISKYGIGWGYASSPAIHQDRVALICDDPSNPHLVVLRLSDGKEIWRVSRKGISERSWGTPLIHRGPKKTHVVVNGWPWVVSYDLDTSKVLWRIHGGGDNPIPTPFVSKGRIYITSAHGAQSPIYVVRPEARGDITPSREAPSKEAPFEEAIVWSTSRGGSYMSTPVVYRGNIYLGSSSIVRCLDAATGKKIYAKRLGSGASIIASLVAADGKIFCASENGTVYVLAAGTNFEVLSRNPMGEPCLATPAISEGVLYFRTTQSLIAIK